MKTASILSWIHLFRVQIPRIKNHTSALNDRPLIVAKLLQDLTHNFTRLTIFSIKRKYSRLQILLQMKLGGGKNIFTQMRLLEQKISNSRSNTSWFQSSLPHSLFNWPYQTFYSITLLNHKESWTYYLHWSLCNNYAKLSWPYSLIWSCRFHTRNF